MKIKIKKENIIKRIIIVLILLLITTFILIKAQNYIKETTDEKTNLIINNNNVTARLKKDVIIENGIIYLSMEDLKNFFDKYIYIEDEINEIITTYDKKIASVGFEVNRLIINGATTKTEACAKKIEDTIYLPISEMTDVYNIEINNIKNKKIITIDSLNREQIKAYTKTNISVKWKTDIFSKTVDRVKKGDTVIAIAEDKKGWTKVRTKNGEIGHIKTSKLTNYTTVREDWGEEKQIEGKVNMVWDYFSQYVQAPDRTGQKIEGVNVVSPSFFYIDSKGELKENVGSSGIEYIKWAN